MILSGNASDTLVLEEENFLSDGTIIIVRTYTEMLNPVQQMTNLQINIKSKSVFKLRIVSTP